VKTRYTRVFKDARSSQSAVLVDGSGERVIANYPSPDLPAEADWLHEIDFSQWDIVLADVRWHDGAKQAFTLARQQGVPTLLDADVTPQDIAELVALSDHAAFSAPGLRRLTQRDETEDALRKAQTLTNGHVYVTQGRDGCFWLENGALRHQPGFEVDVVDTTGRATFSTVRWRSVWGSRASAADAVRFASAVAALKCTSPADGRVYLTVIKPALFCHFLYKMRGVMVFRGQPMSLTELTGNPRHDQLLTLIADRGYMNIDELAQLLDVSTQTVRRDIRKLSEQG
jgi:sulfofructose kinase